MRSLPLLALFLLAGCVDSTSSPLPDTRRPAPSTAHLDVDPGLFAPASLTATASANGTSFLAKDVLLGHFSQPIVYDYTISETLDGAPNAKGVNPVSLGLAGLASELGCSGGAAAILITTAQGRFAVWSGCEAFPASTFSGRFMAFGDTYLRLGGMPSIDCFEGFDVKPCFNWSGTTTISMRRAEADIILTSVTSSQPATELTVARAGDALGLVLRASPSGFSTGGGRTNWRFVPDDGTSATACDDFISDDYCSTFMRKSGTFIVSGVVNGAFKPALNTVHVRVPGPAATLQLINAEGLNPGGSFTLIPSERPISLEARVTPAELTSAVRWIVEDAPGDAVTTALPAVMPTGAVTTVSLPTNQDPARDRYAHQTVTRLDDKALSIRVHAELTTGGQTISTEPKFVTQDQIDVIRQEYRDLSIAFGVPARSRFSDVPRGPQNVGDFDKGILDPTFMGRLNAFKRRWLENNPNFTLNVLYRSPVHNRLHSESGTVGGTSSGTAKNSMHVYGCAADLQTFPTPRNTPARKQAAIDFWEDFAAVAAEDTAIVIEPRVAVRAGQLSSNEGHLHIQACAGALP